MNNAPSISKWLKQHLSYWMVIMVPVFTGCDSERKELKKPVAITEFQIFEDSTSKLSFDEILNLPSTSFAPPATNYLVNSRTLWVKIDTLNLLPDYNYLILAGNAREIELNYFDGRAWTKKLEGLTIKHQTYELQPVFDLSGYTPTKPLYIRMVEPVIPLIAVTKTSQSKAQLQNAIFSTLIVGGLIFIILANVLRYIFSGETIFILYAAYICTFVLNILAFGGNNVLFHVFDMSTQLKFQLHNFSLFGLVTLGGLYGIRFLELKQKSRFFFYLLVSAVTVIAIYYVVAISISWVSAIITNLLVGVLIISLPIAATSLWIKGDRYLIYYILAYIIFAGSHIAYTILRSTDPAYLITAVVPTVFLGYLAESLLLNLSLNRKIDFEKKQAKAEQAKSQKALVQYQKRENERLEEMVSARTKELQQTQSQLIQSEKMASLGVLTAGIAHEINNPVNFIYAGINSLKDNLDDIHKVLEAYEKLEPKNTRIKLSEINDLKKEVEFDKLIEYVDRSALSVLKGAERTSEIVKGLKSFSRIDDDQQIPSDINQILEDTLLLLKNQYKDRIVITKNFTENAWVECSPGKINQVFVNVISNSIQAIKGQGEISITTETVKSDDVLFLKISIKDTGSGISKEEQKRIFEPFYTTKEVGEGTGLGLSISHSIIKDHGGHIEVRSTLGKGTVIGIFLPTYKQQEVKPGAKSSISPLDPIK